MNLMRLLSEPNTGPIKFVPLVVGAAAGIGVTAAIRDALTEPDRADELADRGVPVLDSREATVYAIAAPFGFAAGIGMGLQRRSPTAGFTTAKQLATAALVSTAAGVVNNADSDRAGISVTGTAAMAAAVGGGILLGVRDEVKAFPLRMAGLALFGMAAGAAAPLILDTVRDVPSQIRTSFELRER
jgi:hypothetical protein